MMGRVIFFPMIYSPGLHRIEHLKRLQNSLNDYHAGLMLEALRNNLNDYQKMVRKQSLHNHIRDKWELIQGGKEKSQKIDTTKIYN